MLKIFAAIACFIMFFKGVENDNNFMFVGGIIGICVFLLWELFSIWEGVGMGFAG